MIISDTYQVECLGVHIRLNFLVIISDTYQVDCRGLLAIIYQVECLGDK